MKGAIEKMLQNLNFSFPIIFDIIVVALLFFFALNGRRRGLIKTITGILVLIVAFTGATMLCNWTTPFISKTFVEPKLTETLLPNAQTASGAETAPAENTPQGDPSADSISSILLKLGLPMDTVTKAMEDFQENAVSSVEDAVRILSESVSNKVTYGVLFVIYFVILLIVLSLVARLLDAVARLPVLNAINRVGGFILGLLFGYLAIMLVSYLLTKFNLWLTSDMVDQTVVLKFISRTNPLSLLPFGK